MSRISSYFEKFVVLSFLTVVFVGIRGEGALPVFSETLKHAEVSALQNSGLVKAAKENIVASESQSQASEAALYPKLTLDGTYYYQTNVPQTTLAIPGFPGAAPTLSFGDFNNYRLGPMLSYTLFDGGFARRLWNSTKSLGQMRIQDSKVTERLVVLNTRLAYSKVQLGVKNLTLTATSLILSQSRERDVRNRFKAGAASHLDAVNAKREVLSYQLKFKQAQIDLAGAIRDLQTLTGNLAPANLSRPWPRDWKGALPDEDQGPTFYVLVDALESSLNIQRVAGGDGATTSHPQIKSLAYGAEASRLASDAQRALLWPRLQFSARAEYMYPNGTVLQSVQQNVFTVNMSMPIFEGSLNRSLAQQRQSEGASLERQREQKITDFDRDRKKAKDLLENLRAQESLSQENAKAAAEAAKLTYQSYKAGKKPYLDVESANLRLLEAQVGAAQIQAGIFSAIAQLNFLAPQVED